MGNSQVRKGKCFRGAVEIEVSGSLEVMEYCGD